MKTRPDKARKRQLINSFKRQPCVDCKQQFHPWQMDFDHSEPRNKRTNVSLMVSCSDKQILEEIAKCEVVCANCHRHRTYIENQAKYGYLRLI